MKASVIIVTYNRLNLLKECINCVENQLIKFADVIIVDNASTDGTCEFLAQFEGKYHIIRRSVNEGGAMGFQEGIEYIQENIDTDWILMIDDDAMLSDNYLKDIITYTEKLPECKAFSGSVRTDGEIDITHRKRISLGMEFKIIPVPEKEYEKEYFDYDLCTFCGLFFKASLIKKIGAPRGDYFIWYDDTEYSLRIRKESKIININSAWINHRTKKTIVNNKLNWRGFYGIRNRGDVILNYGTKNQYFLYRLKISCSMYKNLLASIFIKGRNYKYNYELYRDALEAMKSRKFGFNSKYHF